LAAAIIGLVSVTSLERLGMPVPVALAMGFLLLAAAALSAANVAVRGTSQWGPDPEQVIGRKTGARI
jgi:hypothetical protein